jgi:hypothetical protein
MVVRGFPFGTSVMADDDGRGGVLFSPCEIHAPFLHGRPLEE